MVNFHIMVLLLSTCVKRITYYYLSLHRYYRFECVSKPLTFFLESDCWHDNAVTSTKDFNTKVHCRLGSCKFNITMKYFISVKTGYQYLIILLKWRQHFTLFKCCIWIKWIFNGLRLCYMHEYILSGEAVKRCPIAVSRATRLSNWCVIIISM